VTGATGSPSAPEISFFSDRDGNGEIYVMNADGSNQTRVTNDAASDFVSTWSGDQARLAFDTNRDGNWEIYSITPGGSGLVRLTTHSADDEAPMWRP
jgi:Tol biopolymer transport system component